MRKYFSKLPEELKNLIAQVAKVSDDSRMPAYLVGGFVRDMLLGVKNLDMDIVVEGSGIEFAQKLMPKLKAKIIIHQRFGTATLSFGKLKVDLASARQETYAHPGDLPEVSFSSLSDDLKRRDFTINAMAVSISGKMDLRLIDPFDGKNDLAGRKIRVLHDLSFQDDPTRIFRAVRFEQRYGFKIQPRTLILLKYALNHGYLGLISPQRKRHELILILKENNPYQQIKRLKDLKALDLFCREFSKIKINRSLFAASEKQIAWFNQEYPGRRKLDTWLIYFMALIDGLTYVQSSKLSIALNLRTGEEKRILSLKSFSKSCLRDLSSIRITPPRIFVLLEPLSYETIIFLKAKYASLILKKHISDFMEIYNGMRVCVSGEVLQKLGVLPGPKYKVIFSKVLHAKLNGSVKSPQDEVALIRKLIKQ
ncbi:MAG: CCA tRNA nucleotidyltransferase [Candidatus Omnitrophica bacterium]|jgi:tRNA nucleotidyltransferase (CCA-adding enzyme)|nr:CCA tRNA nucleotidyltransferase [Candidatus Omnitrophota bacterium]